jgi:hypothetical protein
MLPFLAHCLPTHRSLRTCTVYPTRITLPWRAVCLNFSFHSVTVNARSTYVPELSAACSTHIETAVRMSLYTRPFLPLQLHFCRRSIIHSLHIRHSLVR